MVQAKVLIVTGGSGAIGTAIAQKAAKLGYKVCISYFNNEERASQTVSQIKRIGGKVLSIHADTSCEKDVINMFNVCEDTFGSITHLVNNAGIVGSKTKVQDLPLSMLKRVFDVNVIGYFLCAKEAIRRMSIRNHGIGGAIVNVSSRASKLGNPNEWVHYAASKGAIDTFTIGLAREVACDGIRVNAVNPGLIDTDIHASAGVPDRIARLSPTVPMGRPGTVEEVAEAIMFLLSDSASYITGTCLEISGGR